MEWTSIILAGGQSRRMGVSKALLDVQDKTMIEHLVSLLEPFSNQIVIVTNERDEARIHTFFKRNPKVQIIKDDPQYQGAGPLAGIYSAMKQIASQRYFVCACDLSCLDSQYLRGLQHLALERPEFEAYIPLLEEKMQPLAGLFQGETERLEHLLQLGQRKMMHFVQELHTYFIQETEWRKWTSSENPFYNMNTPHDYQLYIEKIRNS